MSEALPEEEFRKKIHDQFPRHFEYIYHLHQFVEEVMSSCKAQAGSSTHTAYWLILAKAFKSFDAIRRLCEIAYCEDAGVILRSLLNLLAITRWISADSKRAAKYLAWYWIEMHSNVHKYKDLIDPQFLEVIEKRYEVARKLFEYDDNGKKRFPDKWHQPEANTIREMFEQVDLLQHYDEAYKPLSGIEHSDATAYLPMIVGMEKATGERSLNVHNPAYVPHILRNAFQYFADIFELCNQTLRIVDPAEEFDGLRKAGMTFYAEDVNDKADRASSH